MINTSKTKALIMYLFFLLPLSAWGQELIRTVHLQKSENSIIRDISEKEWLVYNVFLWSDSMEKAFVKVTETGVSAPIMFLPNMVKTVNDFEIYDGYVYFCGENNAGIGMMGRFKLSDFPTAQVCMWSVPALMKMNKLDVKEMNSTLHVVMTGETALNSQHLVDAWEPSASSANWVFNVTEVDDDWLFDDVAITASWVVFSGRNVAGNTAGFIYYAAPPTSASVFTATTPYYQQAPNANAISRVILIPSVANNFAFVTDNPNDLTLGEYDAASRTPVWQKTIWQTSLSCVDLAFNTLSPHLDFVAKPSSASVPTVVFHPSSTPYLPAPPLMYGRYYQYNAIQSLDAIDALAGYFVAAGTENNLNYLMVYKYKYNDWPGCFSQTEVPFDILTKSKKDDKFELNTRIFSFNPECMSGEPTEAVVATECIR